MMNNDSSVNPDKNTNRDIKIKNPIRENSSKGFLLSFISGNYFYIISALLMMLGSYMLMRSPFAKGSEYIHTLKTLLILQGYEILIIITAVIIVRKLNFLGDAFTLLIIEIILLLDPTFFANNFYTLHITTQTYYGAMTNLVCFLLVPVKLLILRHFLRVKVSPQMFGAFIFASIIVYISEFPLAYMENLSSQGSYYYLLPWLIFILSLLLPQVTKICSINSNDENFISSRQRISLPRLLFILPIIISLLHVFETSMVYQVKFYLCYLSPMSLALCILFIKNIKDDKLKDKIFLIDMFSVMALFFSLNLLNFLDVPSKALYIANSSAPPTPKPTPFIILHKIPIFISSLVCLSIYLYYYLVKKYKPAVYRIAVFAIIAFLYILLKIGLIASVGSFAAGKTQNFYSYLSNNPILIRLTILVILGAVAIKFRYFLPWLIFGFYTIIFVYSKLPITHTKFLPEIIQICILYFLVLLHIFKLFQKDPGLYGIAILIPALAAGRFIDSYTLIYGLIVVFESLCFIFAGYFLKRKGYVNIGILVFIVFLIIIYSKSGIKLNFPLLFISSGLILFILGIFVTFNKKALINHLQKNVGKDICDKKIISADAADDKNNSLLSKEYTDKNVSEISPNEIIRKETTEKSDPEKAILSNENIIDGILSPAAEKKEPEGGEGFCQEMPSDEQTRKVIEQQDEESRLYLESLFIHQPSEGVLLYKNLSDSEKEDLKKDISQDIREDIVVCFAAKLLKPLYWQALLTTRRIILRNMGNYGIYYLQISKISRNFDTLIFQGHSEQYYTFQGLSVNQAKSLKIGMEKLIAEIALDKYNTNPE